MLKTAVSVAYKCMGYCNLKSGKLLYRSAQNWLVDWWDKLQIVLSRGRPLSPLSGFPRGENHMGLSGIWSKFLFQRDMINSS